MTIYYGNELYHYGAKGMHWGERRYQNKDGSLTPEGRIHYGYGEARTKLDKASNEYAKIKNRTHFFDRERKAARAEYKNAKREYRDTTRVMDKDISNTKQKYREEWEKKNRHAYGTAKTMKDIADYRAEQYEDIEDEDQGDLFNAFNSKNKTIAKYEQERANENYDKLTRERDEKVTKKLIKEYGEETINEYNSREGRQFAQTLLVAAGALSLTSLALSNLSKS